MPQTLDPFKIGKNPFSGLFILFYNLGQLAFLAPVPTKLPTARRLRRPLGTPTDRELSLRGASASPQDHELSLRGASASS